MKVAYGGYLGVVTLSGKDQSLCKGRGTIQVRIKTEVTASTLSSGRKDQALCKGLGTAQVRMKSEVTASTSLSEGLLLQTCKGGQDGGDLLAVSSGSEVCLTKEHKSGKLNTCLKRQENLTFVRGQEATESCQRLHSTSP